MSTFSSALEKYNAAYNSAYTPEELKKMLSKASAAQNDAGTVEPCDAVDALVLGAEIYELGLSLIEKREVAVVTMAGGQGTRLGYAGPKGCYDIGIGMSLFELQARRIAALSREIPWYVMTSEENNAATEAFFEKNENFGLENVTLFTQGMLPTLTLEGEPLLAAKNSLALNPDGNGGVFAALKNKGVLDDIGRRGIRYVVFCGIDNALARMCDPLFVGFAASSGLEGASKSVLKTDPEEKAGAFCRRNGKPGIIEYYELSPEMRYAKAADGSLLYGDANIVAHIISADALRRICGKGLPLHSATKKVPYFDGTRTVEPDVPNACKLEAFIFDAFSMLDGMAIMRVRREEEFAPVKNLTGTDSPETALKLVKNAEKFI